MLCRTAESSVRPASWWWAPYGHSPSSLPWGAKNPWWGNLLVLPSICKGWSAAQLNSCSKSRKTSSVTSAIQISTRCGDITALWFVLITGSFIYPFFFFKCSMYLVIIFSWNKWITWKLSHTVLSSLIQLVKFIEKPLKTSHQFFFSLESGTPS